MPSISEITDSISVPSLIKDEVIRNGEFENRSRGVIFYAGGFTVVFPVKANGKKWAFRCWHTEMGNVRERFKIISDYINRLNSDYFCDFYYLDSGLIVNGKLFPTTRMTWVEGETINQYIFKNSHDKKKLLSLANEFLKMVDYLHANRVAHGDLQHGNIIITNKGEIKLVDYDSLFVPGLEGESDIITGKAEFQHPNRNQLKITSEKLDYFSEIIIYLSILAIAYDSGIIKDFSIEDSLLFQASDWNDFENSKIYKRLIGLENRDITLLTDILISYLREANISNLKPFPEIWKNLQKEPKLHSFECGKADNIVFRGLETEISWIVDNAGKIILNDMELSEGQSSYKMIFQEDADLTLTIKNGLHTVEKTKHIKVVDAPIIEFSVDNHKLKKGKEGIETAKLTWNASNVLSVNIKENGKILSSDCTASDFIIHPQKDSSYVLVAVGLDGVTKFTATIEVAVRESAKVMFSSDKMFTLPNVPFTISWHVQGAKNVRLNGNSVGIKGQSVFTISENQTYTLTYDDYFGESSEELIVRMLPLPIIKSIMVDTPNINNALSIQYSTPQFKEMPTIPVIESTFANIAIPVIPSIIKSGCFVKLPESPRLKITQKISLFLRTLFK